LESIAVTSDKYERTLFPLVESCIPEYVLTGWLRNPGTIDKEDDGKSIFGDKLKDLLSFLRIEVEGEERISLVKSVFKLSGDATQKENRKKQVEEMAATATDVFPGKKKKNSVGCLFCERSSFKRRSYYQVRNKKH
jgi:hypothetical protein